MPFREGHCLFLVLASVSLILLVFLPSLPLWAAEQESDNEKGWSSVPPYDSRTIGGDSKAKHVWLNSESADLNIQHNNEGKWTRPLRPPLSPQASDGEENAIDQQEGTKELYRENLPQDATSPGISHTLLPVRAPCTGGGELHIPGTAMNPRHALARRASEARVEPRHLSGSEWVNHTIGTGADGAIGIWTGDLDGDDDPDLAGVNWNGGELVWFTNDGDGGLNNRQVIAACGTAGDVWGDDIDGDGDIDLLAVCYNGFMMVLKSKGDGTFDSLVQVNTGTDARGITTGDLDGDGSHHQAVTVYFESKSD